jgi:hypothetical protein
VFHVSLLKVVGNYQVEGNLPNELDIVVEEDIYPEKILGSRITLHNGVATPQSLVQWKNKSVDKVTWEDSVVLKGQFPEFCLEDKVVSIGGGIDREVNFNMGPNHNHCVMHEVKANRTKVEDPDRCMSNA